MPEKNRSQPPESQKFKDFSDSSLGKQVGHRIEKIKIFKCIQKTSTPSPSRCRRESGPDRVHEDEKLKCVRQEPVTEGMRRGWRGWELFGACGVTIKTTMEWAETESRSVARQESRDGREEEGSKARRWESEGERDFRSSPFVAHPVAGNSHEREFSVPQLIAFFIIFLY